MCKNKTKQNIAINLFTSSVNSIHFIIYLFIFYFACHTKRKEIEPIGAKVNLRDDIDKKLMVKFLWEMRVDDVFLARSVERQTQHVRFAFISIREIAL